MKYSLKPSVAILFLALTTFSCATSYQSSGFKGGYTETRLAEHIFQVRFNANGYSSTDRTSKFLMRRCAELTLEQGKQYFTIRSNQLGNQNMGLQGRVFSFPSGQATITLLEDKDASEMALDATIIIEETSGLANGRLSNRATETLRILKSSQEEKEKVIATHGKVILYSNLSRVKRKPFDLSLDMQHIGVIDKHYAYPAMPGEFGESNTISKRLPIGQYTINIISEGCNCSVDIEVGPNIMRAYQISKLGKACQVKSMKTWKYKENI